MGVCVFEEGDLICKLGCVRLSFGLIFINVCFDNECFFFVYLDFLKICVKVLEVVEVVYYKVRFGCMWIVLSIRIILLLVFFGGLCILVFYVLDGGF